MDGTTAHKTGRWMEQDSDRTHTKQIHKRDGLNSSDTKAVYEATKQKN